MKMGILRDIWTFKPSSGSKIDNVESNSKSQQQEHNRN